MYKLSAADKRRILKRILQYLGTGAKGIGKGVAGAGKATWQGMKGMSRRISETAKRIDSYIARKMRERAKRMAERRYYRQYFESLLKGVIPEKAPWYKRVGKKMWEGFWTGAEKATEAVAFGFEDLKHKIKFRNFEKQLRNIRNKIIYPGLGAAGALGIGTAVAKAIKRKAERETDLWL